ASASPYIPAMGRRSKACSMRRTARCTTRSRASDTGHRLPNPFLLLSLARRPVSLGRHRRALDEPRGGGYMKLHKLPVRGRLYGSIVVGVGRRGEGSAVGPHSRRGALSPAARRVVSRAERGVALRRRRCAWHAPQHAPVLPR